MSPLFLVCFLGLILSQLTSKVDGVHSVIQARLDTLDKFLINVRQILMIGEFANQPITFIHDVADPPSSIGSQPDGTSSTVLPSIFTQKRVQNASFTFPNSVHDWPMVRSCHRRFHALQVILCGRDGTYRYLEKGLLRFRISFGLGSSQRQIFYLRLEQKPKLLVKIDVRFLKYFNRLIQRVSGYFDGQDSPLSVYVRHRCILIFASPKSD